MPILERDPWRLQYFEHVSCPDDVNIPTDDPDCWLLYPEHRWVYDKLKIAQSQGLRCGPHGVMPDRFPVFSKPMMNLKGMGIGSQAIGNAEEMHDSSQPGHMWMELLQGPHVSTDCAVVDGRIVWSSHATGVPWHGGMFKYWVIHCHKMEGLDEFLATWTERHMRGYSGMMNFETIGGTIIEAHLRFADQWCDLYGQGWVPALVGLYSGHGWNFDGSENAGGFSLPLFAAHGVEFRHPPRDVQREVRAMPGISSLQITFHETKEASNHPMPPGGFRLAVINATDLEAGKKARQKLARSYPARAIFDPDHSVLSPEVYSSAKRG